MEREVVALQRGYLASQTAEMLACGVQQQAHERSYAVLEQTSALLDGVLSADSLIRLGQAQQTFSAEDLGAYADTLELLRGNSSDFGVQTGRELGQFLANLKKTLDVLRGGSEGDQIQVDPQARSIAVKFFSRLTELMLTRLSSRENPEPGSPALA